MAVMTNCPYCGRALSGEICSAHGYVGAPGVQVDPIPKGLICMWSGASASVPSGWTLCDGTNGAPDLRDKFIIGAGNTYADAATGGSAAHTHSISLSGTSSELAAQSHSSTTVSEHAANTSGSESSHTHSISFESGVSNTPGSNVKEGTGADQNRQIKDHVHNVNGTSAAGSSHSHSTPALSHASHTHDNHAAHSHTWGASGTSGSGDLPPYYALAFIMKI